MALWGKNDDKTSTGTVQVFANGLVTGTTTDFATEAKVGDYLGINSTVSFVVSSITNATSCHVVSSKLGGSVNAVSSGTNFTLSEKPKFVSFSEVNKGSVAGNPDAVFGVDTTEVGVTQGAGHAGWVRRIAGTGGRAGRVQYEVLVAGSSITGDAADDTEFADS